MRLLFVVQRYGAEVAGGAERACRDYAEQMALRGHTVEVLTSCALSYVDWANEYEPGTSELSGVTVHRLPSAQPRSDHFFGPLHARVMWSPWPRPVHLQRQWSRMQGPLLTGLPGWIDEHVDGFDAAIFFTYLYYPTWAGLRAAHGRVPTVLHPTAHDEPPFRLSLFDSMFRWATAWSFLTPEEQELVEERFRTTRPSIVAGIGVDPAIQGDGSRFREAFGLGDEPYLLYLGRVDPSKGADELVSYHRAFRRRHRGAPRLVVVGEQVRALAGDDDVLCTGFVDEQTKFDALAGCLALAQPSYYESFSIVLTEAWALGRPALVQRHCKVLDGQAHRSGGALPYDGYPEFEAALEMLLDDPPLADRLGAAGRAYVEEHYRWDHILDRYEQLLHQIGAGRRRTATPA